MQPAHFPKRPLPLDQTIQIGRLIRLMRALGPFAKFGPRQLQHGNPDARHRLCRQWTRKGMHTRQDGMGNVPKALRFGTL